MAWTYHCDACGMNIMAAEKTELVDKVMKHANQAHNMGLSRDQVQQTVDNNAKQEAA